MARFKLDRTSLSELPEWFLKYPGSAAILKLSSNYSMLIKEINGKNGILVIYVNDSCEINTSVYKSSMIENHINIYNHFCLKSEDVICIIDLETKIFLQISKLLVPVEQGD